ncbi:helix-turn-helix transcriptional regulator [Sporolactobacillus laevolacticus]|uniref:HTH deoR-type domain-containing protein n=1 Tax=Sporolactobacillus laevolacticus DSM 442 TaxID=1395513 RepID=V6JA33_9BACL|nr:WYL domain-containing protein [Sporolactobacillus laevolacticus]EST13639.1 hypothetical protein P343_00095 [Sporolactobacillus laevolacticus DSM 442]
MRADRLVAIILLLQTEGTVSAKMLASRLEVSERTIYRDIDALSFAGIPIISLRGSCGGFTLDEHFRTNVSGINLTDIKKLLVRQSADPLADLGLNTNYRIIYKLFPSLSSNQRKQADQFSKRIYLDSTTWFNEQEAVPFLKLIYEAMYSNLWLLIDYVKKNGDVISRQVAPYGLVAKTDTWYMVASHGEDIRVYRVSRIHDIKSVAKSFLIPKSFELDQFWNKWCHYFETSRPKYSATLRMSLETLHEFLVSENRNFQQLSEEKDGKQLICIQFENFAHAVREILSLGSEVEVIKPNELRKEISNQIKRLYEIYQ